MSNSRASMWLAIGAGGMAGGAIPMLWGAGPFSGWGVLLEAIGSLSGLWLWRHIAG